MARNYRIPCPVLAGSGVCDQRLDAELPAMESTWQPLVSLPAGWEQLCSTQTPPGSALPLAPCLPHTSPSASSCPQQDQDPRTPLQEPPEGHGGPPLSSVRFHPRRRDLALFSQPGDSEFGRWGHRRHPHSPVLPSFPCRSTRITTEKRQRGREKARQRICLHAPVQSSLLMRRIWLLVSRGVCPVG